MNNTKATRGKISSLTVQYIAGFFDGEGGINIYQIKPTRKWYRKNIGYTLSVFIHNTDKRIIDLFNGKYGGYVNIRKRKSDKWKTGYDWKLSSCQAKNFLKEIVSYLILKKERAKIAIEFQEVKERKLWRFGQNPKEVLDFYELCYQKMRLLNKKGTGTYYPQRLNEETLKKEVIIRTALKNAEMDRNNPSTLQKERNEIAIKGGIAVLKKYGKEYFKTMRSRVGK